MARHVSASRLLNRTHTIGLYFANQRDGELDTAPLMARLWAARKCVGCPVTQRTYGGHPCMDLWQVEPETRLTENRFRIPEPRTRGSGAARYLHPLTISTLFLPLVAFDHHGSRLGMGAGYYDRYLGRQPVTLRPLLVGLAHEIQRSPAALTRQPWDVPLDAVVTEDGWQPFSPRAEISGKV